MVSAADFCISQVSSPSETPNLIAFIVILSDDCVCPYIMSNQVPLVSEVAGLKSLRKQNMEKAKFCPLTPLNTRCSKHEVRVPTHYYCL